MSFSLTQANTVTVVIGVAIWAIAIGAIWLVHRGDPALHREEDFRLWKAINQKPNASFGQFLASEQTPRTYLSRLDLSIAATALALLALILALRHWGVWK